MSKCEISVVEGGKKKEVKKNSKRTKCTSL